MKLIKTMTLTLALLSSPLALAHAGVHLSHGFVEGLLHPLTGLDHLLMLLGVGAMGAWMVAEKRLALYAGAITSLLGGALLGLATGWGTGVEEMILLSLFVMAACLFFKRSNPVAMVAALMLVLFHGWAHGIEMPAGEVAVFLPGMLLMAAILMSFGFLLGSHIRPKWLGVGSGVAAALIAALG